MICWSVEWSLYTGFTVLEIILCESARQWCGRGYCGPTCTTKTLTIVSGTSIIQPPRDQEKLENLKSRGGQNRQVHSNMWVDRMVGLDSVAETGSLDSVADLQRYKVRK